MRRSSSSITHLRGVAWGWCEVVTVLFLDRPRSVRPFMPVARRCDALRGTGKRTKGWPAAAADAYPGGRAFEIIIEEVDHVFSADG
jgi:hypothetical protein